MAGTIMKQVLSSILLLAVVVAGSGVVYAQISGHQLLSVQSESMVPAIKKGELVTVKSVPDYKVGDVITFTNPTNARQTFTHRITELPSKENNYAYITKGDANTVTDAPVRKKAILGKVTHTIPYAGYGVDFIRKPIGLVLIIYIPALMVVIAELRKLIRYYAAQKIYVLPSFYRKKRAAFGGRVIMGAKVTAFFVAISFGVVATTRAALTSTATLANSSLSVLVPQEPEPINVCLFPGNESLLSYAIEDAFYPELPNAPLLLPEPLPAGSYHVTARSTDMHTPFPNNPNQPNERWYAQLYGKDLSLPLISTGVTDDIPASDDEVTTVINEAIEFAEPVTALRYVHEAAASGLEIDRFGGRRYDDLTLAEKRQVVWNSVHPACMTFTPVTDEVVTGRE